MGNTQCGASRRAGSAGVSAALPEFYMAKGGNLRPKAWAACAHRLPCASYATNRRQGGTAYEPD
jgi:hypothetical protein